MFEKAIRLTFSPQEAKDLLSLLQETRRAFMEQVAAGLLTGQALETAAKNYKVSLALQEKLTKQ